MVRIKLEIPSLSRRDFVDATNRVIASEGEALTLHCFRHAHFALSFKLDYKIQ